MQNLTYMINEYTVVYRYASMWLALVLLWMLTCLSWVFVDTSISVSAVVNVNLLIMSLCWYLKPKNKLSVRGQQQCHIFKL